MSALEALFCSQVPSAHICSFHLLEMKQVSMIFDILTCWRVRQVSGNLSLDGIWRSHMAPGPVIPAKNPRAVWKKEFLRIRSTGKVTMDISTREAWKSFQRNLPFPTVKSFTQRSMARLLLTVLAWTGFSPQWQVSWGHVHPRVTTCSQVPISIPAVQTSHWSDPLVWWDCLRQQNRHI